MLILEAIGFVVLAIGQGVQIYLSRKAHRRTVGELDKRTLTPVMAPRLVTHLPLASPEDINGKVCD